MEADRLIEFLDKERDYHAKHPFEVLLKFLYSLGASLAALVSSFYFTGKINDVKQILSGPFGIAVLLMFLLAIAFIFWGLDEHTKLHLQQRRKIELAINFILKNYTGFDFDAFWKTHSEHHLKWRRKILKNSTLLITLEPDSRNYWQYHDRKIELGIVLLLLAYTLLIVAACRI